MQTTPESPPKMNNTKIYEILRDNEKVAVLSNIGRYADEVIWK